MCAGPAVCGVRPRPGSTYSRSMRRDAKALLLFALAIGLGALGSQVSGAASIVLLGDQTIAPKSDSNPAGSAEAFKTNATASGTVATLTVYVDTGSTATSLVAGLYADAAGKPGALLGAGTLTSPAAAAWNTVALTTGVSVTSGTAYWIALLGPSGTLRFRDHCCSAASPTLVVSPASLSFTASVGGPDPATQPLGISNSGSGTLSWTATKTAS